MAEGIFEVVSRDQVVVIDYTNHRGERRERTIIPGRLSFEETPDHKPSQWVVRAWDMEKQAQRTFACAKIHSWRRAVP